jgi:hypothetical protein
MNFEKVNLHVFLNFNMILISMLKSLIRYVIAELCSVSNLAAPFSSRPPSCKHWNDNDDDDINFDLFYSFEDALINLTDGSTVNLTDGSTVNLTDGSTVNLTDGSTITFRRRTIPSANFGSFSSDCNIIIFRTYFNYFLPFLDIFLSHIIYGSI